MPAPDGFDVGGTDLQIGFGRAQAGAVVAAAKLLGEPPSQSGAAGACSRVVWTDGLTMDFRNGAFVGWIDPVARSGATHGGQPC